MSLSQRMLVFGFAPRQSERSMRKAATDRARSLARATRMLVFIVTLYLVSFLPPSFPLPTLTLRPTAQVTNVPSLFITVWEHADRRSLIKNHGVFYTFFTDFISLLTILTGCLRLPAYLM